MNICLQSKTVKTRKPHKCITCRDVIPVGSEVNYNVSLYEGNFCSSYMCNICQSFLDKNRKDYTEFEEGCFLEDDRYEEFKNNY